MDGENNFSQLSPAQQAIYPLHLAVFNSDRTEAQKLLEAGTNLVDSLYQGDSPLLWAIRNKNIAIVRLLMEHKARVNLQDQREMTPLMWAAGENSTELAQLLVQHGAHINLQDEDGDNALIYAAMTSSEIVQVLVDNGAELNLQNYEGYTALIYAAKENCSEIVQLLVDNGAEINLKNKEGDTALMYAAQENSSDIVQLLVDNDAKLNLQNDEGYTALIYAAMENSSEVLKLLVYNGAEINHKDKEGDTALLTATFCNSHYAAKLLVDNGAMINIQNNEGDTALIYAAQENCSETVKLLVDNGADINLQNNDGCHALMYAARENCSEIVKLLVGAGANIHLKDKKERTALDLAKQNHHEGVIQFLQNHSLKKKKRTTNHRSDDVEGYIGNKDIDDVLKFLGEGDSAKLEKKSGNQSKKKKKRSKNKKSTEGCDNTSFLVNNPGASNVSGNESDQNLNTDTQKEDNGMSMKELVDVLPENERWNETLADEESGWETVSNPRDAVRSRVPILDLSSRVPISDVSTRIPISDVCSRIPISDVSSASSHDLSRQMTDSRYTSQNHVSASSEDTPNRSGSAFSHEGDKEVPSTSTSDGRNAESTSSESYSSVICSKGTVRSDTVSHAKEENQTEIRDQMPGSKRPIVIDGSNVAMLHGVHDKFSVKGIELVVDHFKELGHNVVAMLPQYRSNPNQTDSRDTLLRMEKEKTVVFTPSRTVDGEHINSYDDRMILDYAVDVGAVIISKDNFKDLLKEDRKYKEAIKNRLLMPTFIDDRLYFPKDPLGRKGPSLHVFLRF